MKIFSQFSNNIISIDIGSFETKIIQGIKEKEKVKIIKYFIFETPKEAYTNGYITNQSELINKVKEELKKNKIKAGPCYLCIKSTDIITREIQLPILENKEIDSLLKYQLPEYLPMDYSKYMIQHKIIRRLNDNHKEKLNVLVVAIPKDIIDMHYDFVRKLGLKPVVLDYQPNCSWKVLKFSNLINDLINTTEKSIAAIDLGYDSTNVLIINRGMIQTTRIISTKIDSFDNFTNDEIFLLKSNIENMKLNNELFIDNNKYVAIIRKRLEYIAVSIDRVFKFYLSKDINNEIEILVLYGGLSNICGIDNFFSNYFGIPATVINKLNKLNDISNLNRFVNCIGSLIRDDEG